MKTKNLMHTQEFPKYFGLATLFFAFLNGAFYYLSIVISGGDAYSTAEWLNNYSAGFVRRGLFGTIFLWLTPDATYSIWFLFGFQTLLVGMIFLFFASELLRRDSNWFLTILICSPAAIAFYGWAGAAFGRKEFLGYATLIFLAYRVRLKKQRMKSITFLSIAFFTFTLGVYSWEPTAFFLPSFLLLIWRGFAKTELNLAKIATISSFVLVGISGLLTPTIFPGTPEKAKLICAAAQNGGFVAKDLCRGSIRAIGDAPNALQVFIDYYPHYLFYFPLILLALLPFFLGKVFTRKHNHYLFVAISFLPLFAVSDYGRWTAMVVISVLICVLTLEEFSLNKQFSKGYVAAIYILGWGIPHWADPSTDFPIVGAISPLVRHVFYEFLVN